MKKLLFTLTLAGALALGGQSAFAQAKKKPATPADAVTAVADKAKAAADAPKAAAEAVKPKKDTIPMYVRADEVDATAKTITQVNKDGTKAVNTVTAKTEIKNADKEAKFEDIKKGEWVSGLRKKTGENAYEVVKITKFGPKAEKPAGEKKPAEKKGEAPAKPTAK